MRLLDAILGWLTVVLIAGALWLWLVYPRQASRPVPAPTGAISATVLPASPPATAFPVPGPIPQPQVSIAPCPSAEPILVLTPSGYGCFGVATAPTPASFAGCEKGYHPVSVPVSRDYPDGIRCDR